MKKKYYYICDDCGKDQSTTKIKKPNPDSGKMLCQKCSCKYTNARKSKRDKNRVTMIDRWENGEMECLREQYRDQRVEWNKTTQVEKAKNRSNKARSIIGNKKRNTFHARPKEEQEEINHRRTSAFREYNKLSHERKIEYLKSLSREDAIASREYTYITGDDWKEVRKRELKKVNNTCQKCGKENGLLDVHHVIPFVLAPNNDDLMVLCRKCHRKVEVKFKTKYSETNDIQEAKQFSLEGINVL